MFLRNLDVPGEILVLAERRITISLDIAVMPALFPFPRGTEGIWEAHRLPLESTPGSGVPWAGRRTLGVSFSHFWVSGSH